MLQYISYLQLCSNVLQNKLSRRQQKYIVDVYKTVQRLRIHSFYRIIGSVVFQVTFSERETKCPRLKEKYTNHEDLTPLNTTGEPWLCPSAAGEVVAGSLQAPASQCPSLSGGPCGMALSCPST
jgi:hypothetical protein